MNLTDYCIKRKKQLIYNATNCYGLLKIFKKCKKNMGVYDFPISHNSDGSSVIRFKKINEDYFEEYNSYYKYLHDDKKYFVWYKEVYSKQDRKKSNKKENHSKIKNKIIDRDGGRCISCGTNENLTIDHIVPISKSFDRSYYNLMTLCHKCNVTKFDNDLPDDFIKKYLIPIIVNRKQSLSNV